MVAIYRQRDVCSEKLGSELLVVNCEGFMLLTGQDQLRNFGRFSLGTNDIQATLSKIRRYSTLKIVDGQRKGHEKKDQN